MKTLNSWYTFCCRHCTPRTAEHYHDCLEAFRDFIEERQLTQGEIEDYVNTKFLDGWCGRTVNSNLTAIRSFCRWRAEKYGLPNPAENIPMLPEDPPKQRILSKAEYQKVLKVAHGKQRDMIIFLANTGLRLSEFNSLTWQNISPDWKQVRIIGKGRKVRVVPLNDAVRKVLKTYDQDGGRLPFTCPEYKSKAQGICKRLAKKAGIESFGPHALRHFFATQLAIAGVGIYKISKLLGHSSVKTTEKVYVHIAAHDLDGLTDCLG